jgi:heme/copper-type cytochrome/quinol oxidase subunit 4
MKKSESGLYIFFTNLLLILVFISNNDTSNVKIISCIFSSIIAILLNIYFLRNTNKKKYNIIGFILNIILFDILLILSIYKVI